LQLIMMFRRTTNNIDNKSQMDKELMNLFGFSRCSS
jgi:hypothetical protein